MAKIAQLHDGTLLEFPDETESDVIDRAVAQHLGIPDSQDIKDERHIQALDALIQSVKAVHEGLSQHSAALGAVEQKHSAALGSVDQNIGAIHEAREAGAQTVQQVGNSIKETLQRSLAPLDVLAAAKHPLEDFLPKLVIMIENVGSVLETISKRAKSLDVIIDSVNKLTAEVAKSREEITETLLLPTKVKRDQDKLVVEIKREQK
jgi:ABC-type transporter Mla subunit MlaD